MKNKYLHIIIIIFTISLLPFLNLENNFNLKKYNDYIFFTSFFTFVLGFFMKLNEKRMLQYIKYTIYSINNFILSFSQKEKYINKIENNKKEPKKAIDFMLQEINKNEYTNKLIISSIILIILNFIVSIKFFM